MKRLTERLTVCIEFLEKFVDRWWYGPILFLLAGLDHYVLVFPILGMMASSIFLCHRKWFSLSLWSALGSWAGAWLLAWLAQNLGISFIENYFPEMLQTTLWAWMQSFFVQYGLWLLLLVGLAPMPQQPAVIIVALAGTSLVQIAVVLLLAKLIKFLLIGYLASHAPQKLARFREVRGELEELHINPPISEQKS